MTTAKPRSLGSLKVFCDNGEPSEGFQAFMERHTSTKFPQMPCLIFRFLSAAASARLFAAATFATNFALGSARYSLVLAFVFEANMSGPGQSLSLTFDPNLPPPVWYESCSSSSPPRRMTHSAVPASVLEHTRVGGGGESVIEGTVRLVYVEELSWEKKEGLYDEGGEGNESVLASDGHEPAFRRFSPLNKEPRKTACARLMNFWESCIVFMEKWVRLCVWECENKMERRSA